MDGATRLSQSGWVVASWYEGSDIAMRQDMIPWASTNEDIVRWRVVVEKRDAIRGEAK